MIFPIWTIYIFSISPPIISLYRLTIATLYKHLHIKYIEITYNIVYKGSLYFAIPDVSREKLLSVRTITAHLVPFVKSFTFTEFGCSNPKVVFGSISRPAN